MIEQGLRERKKQRTRQAIATVALELFAQRGYQHTTVAEIAEAAEVSKGTLFAYFPSKEEIVFADTAPLREDLCRELRQRTKGLSALETLRAYMADHVVVPGERELLRERLIAENEQLRVHYRARIAEVEDAMAEAIAADMGEPPDGLRPRFAAAAVFAALTIAKQEARKAHGAKASQAEVDAVIDQAVAFIEGGLDAIAPRPARRRRAAS
jgi:TetR/AcrR family transcriptional regulator, regulator of mycofactocin system